MLTTSIGVSDMASIKIKTRSAYKGEEADVTLPGGITDLLYEEHPETMENKSAPLGSKWPEFCYRFAYGFVYKSLAGRYGTGKRKRADKGQGKVVTEAVSVPTYGEGIVIEHRAKVKTRKERKTKDVQKRKVSGQSHIQDVDENRVADVCQTAYLIWHYQQGNGRTPVSTINCCKRALQRAWRSDQTNEKKIKRLTAREAKHERQKLAEANRGLRAHDAKGGYDVAIIDYIPSDAISPKRRHIFTTLIRYLASGSSISEACEACSISKQNGQYYLRLLRDHVPEHLFNDVVRAEFQCQWWDDGLTWPDAERAEFYAVQHRSTGHNPYVVDTIHAGQSNYIPLSAYHGETWTDTLAWSDGCPSYDSWMMRDDRNDYRHPIQHIDTIHDIGMCSFVWAEYIRSLPMKAGLDI